MKQINIRVDDKMAAAIYAKLANQRSTLQSLVQGFFETWLNEDDNVQTFTQKDNNQHLQQNRLNDEIMAKLNQLEKNQDDLRERIANDSINSSDSKVTTNDSSNDSNDSDMIASMIAKIESIEIENLHNKTKLENLQLEFLEFKEKTLNKVEKNDHVVAVQNDNSSSQLEIGSNGLTRKELASLLNRSVRTLENHTKDIKAYTKSIIGKSYKYEVKTRLYYQTND